MKVTWIFLVAIALISLWLVIEKARVRRTIERVFAGRSATDEAAAFCNHFKVAGVSEDVFLGVKSILAEQLDVDMSRLRATDDFSKNLRPLLEQDSMSDVAIIEGVEKHFQIRITDEESEACKTVSNLIALVHKRVGTKNAI